MGKAHGGRSTVHTTKKNSSCCGSTEKKKKRREGLEIKKTKSLIPCKEVVYYVVCSPHTVSL